MYRRTRVKEGSLSVSPAKRGDEKAVVPVSVDPERCMILLRHYVRLVDNVRMEVR
jgi:hypothetical protein